MADRPGQLIADREPQVTLAAVVEQPVRRACRVRAHQDLQGLDMTGRDLLKREVQHRQVISDSVGACVPRPQQTAERFARLIAVGVERKEPVTALVVPGRFLLLGVRSDQRRVHIDRQPLRHAMVPPEPLARPGVRQAQRVKQPRLRSDPVDHAKRGRVRRDRTEQHVLVADRPEIGHALPAVGEHHREIADHPARIMPPTPLLEPRQPQRQCSCEPELVRDLRQQRRARVRHQTSSVRHHFYGYRASITHHLQGEPPSQGSRTFRQPNDPRPAGHFRAPAHRGRGPLLHAPG